MIGFLLVSVLLLTAYNVVAFAFGFERNMIYWVSYGFSTLAILLQTYITYLAFNSAETPKSKFYGFPILNVGLWYLIIQIIAGMGLMSMSSKISFGIALTSQVIIFVVAIMGIITSHSVREIITVQDNQLKEETETMKTLYNEAVKLTFKVTGTEFESDVQKIADEIKYSDPVSSMCTIALEKEMSNLILEIEHIILGKDSDDVKKSLSKFSQILEQRNSVCKLSK